MQPGELTIELPHLRLAARAWGDPSLPPLLALHGWLDNAATFDRVAPLLCAQFHIVAIDMPGHGRSDHQPPGGDGYRFVDGPLHVLGVADTLNWDRFHLLGHSMGGGMASLIAAACPERIERLLLIEALGALTTPPQKSLEQLRRGVTQLREIEKKAPLRVFASADEAIAARMKANGLSREAAELLVLRGIKHVPGGYSWSSDPRLTLASLQRFTEPQVLDILHGIEAPTLLIVAPDSKVKPVEDAAFARRIAQMRDIEVQHLPGGHHLHLENPQPVAQAILDFVSRRAAAPRAVAQAPA